MPDAHYLEASREPITVALHADIRWHPDLDVTEDAADFDFGYAFPHSREREVELCVSHECEGAEDSRDDPFAFAHDVRPPHRYAVPKRNEIVGQESVNYSQICGRIRRERGRHVRINLSQAIACGRREPAE